MQGVGRRDKHCGSDQKGGKREGPGRPGPASLADKPGASIPSGKAIGRSPRFSIEQQDAEQTAPADSS